MDDSIFVGLDQLTILKGVLLAEQGRVLKEVTQTPLHAKTSIFLGSVQGTRKSPYTTSVKVESRINRSPRISGICSCPMSVDCKHVAALAFELLRSGRLNAFIVSEQGADKTDPDPLQTRPASSQNIKQMPVQLADWMSRWAQLSRSIPREASAGNQTNASGPRSQATKFASKVSLVGYALRKSFGRTVVTNGLFNARTARQPRTFRKILA